MDRLIRAAGAGGRGRADVLARGRARRTACPTRRQSGDPSHTGARPPGRRLPPRLGRGSGAWAGPGAPLVGGRRCVGSVHQGAPSRARPHARARSGVLEQVAPARSPPRRPRPSRPQGWSETRATRASSAPGRPCKLTEPVLAQDRARIGSKTGGAEPGCPAAPRPARRCAPPPRPRILTCRHPPAVRDHHDGDDHGAPPPSRQPPCGLPRGGGPTGRWPRNSPRD